MTEWEEARAPVVKALGQIADDRAITLDWIRKHAGDLPAGTTNVSDSPEVDPAADDIAWMGFGDGDESDPTLYLAGANRFLAWVAGRLQAIGQNAELLEIRACTDAIEKLLSFDSKVTPENWEDAWIYLGQCKQYVQDVDAQERDAAMNIPGRLLRMYVTWIPIIS